MDKRAVLVPFDFSGGAVCALERGVGLARQNGCALFVHFVADAALAQGAKERLVRMLQEKGIQNAHTSVSTGDVAGEILNKAREIGAMLIVAGERGGLGLRAIFLGSTTRSLIETSACPVIVAKTPEARPYRKVLIATDFSDASLRLAQQAIELAKDASFLLFHGYLVAPELVLAQRGLVHEGSEAALLLMRQEAEEQMQSFCERLNKAGAIERRVRATYAPAEDILQNAEEWQADLIALCTGGVRTLSTFFMGGTADTLLRRSGADLMVVKA